VHPRLLLLYLFLTLSPLTALAQETPASQPATASGPVAPSAVCGNSVLERGEACDDGNSKGGDGCRYDCSGREVCGDGVLDSGEVCDDGNRQNGDGCRYDCLGEEHCGDGLLDGEEVCDDGNLEEGDGCSSTCAQGATPFTEPPGQKVFRRLLSGTLASYGALLIGSGVAAAGVAGRCNFYSRCVGLGASLAVGGGVGALVIPGLGQLYSGHLGRAVTGTFLRAGSAGVGLLGVMITFLGASDLGGPGGPADIFGPGAVLPGLILGLAGAGSLVWLTGRDITVPLLDSSSPRSKVVLLPMPRFMPNKANGLALSIVSHF
jgi:cysteine-rich repeat protein